MNAANVIWLMHEEMERDLIGTAIEYASPRNGHVDRAAAATAILEKNNVLVDPRNPAHFFVASDEHGMFVTYDVHWGDPPSCTCEDHANRNYIFCKHILVARRLYYLERAFQMAEIPTRRRKAKRTPPPPPAYDYQDDIALLYGVGA